MPIGYANLNPADPEDRATLWDHFRDQVDFTDELTSSQINEIIWSVYLGTPMNLQGLQKDVKTLVDGIWNGGYRRDEI